MNIQIPGIIPGGMWRFILQNNWLYLIIADLFVNIKNNHMPSKILTQSNKSKRLEHYSGEWVVFVDEKIVAHNKTLSEAMAEVERKGLREKASVFRVPRKDEGPYILLII